MAYTAPTQRTTGTLITASIYNTDIIDNIDFLGTSHNHDGDTGDGATLNFSQRLDVVTASAQVTNTTSACDLYTFTLAGSTLSTNNLVRVEMWGLYNNTCGNSDLSMRLKYGGTTIGTLSQTRGNDGDMPLHFEGMIIGDTTEAKQVGMLSWQLAIDGGASDSDRTAHGTTSINSESNQDIVIEVQHGVNSTLITFTMHSATTELLKAL